MVSMFIASSDLSCQNISVYGNIDFLSVQRDFIKNRWGQVHGAYKRATPHGYLKIKSAAIATNRRTIWWVIWYKLREIFGGLKWSWQKWPINSSETRDGHPMSKEFPIQIFDSNILFKCIIHKKKLTCIDLANEKYPSFNSFPQTASVKSLWTIKMVKTAFCSINSWWVCELCDFDLS